MTRPLVMMIALGVVVLACTSSSPGPTGPSAAQACSDASHASCARLDACWKNGTTIQWGDVPTCESRMQLSCLAALAAPSTGRTTTSEESCAQAIPAESCTDFFDNSQPAPCRPPAGGLGNGAGCAFSAQCASAFCGFAPAAACGTCQPAPTVGTSCANLESCGPGLVCANGACAAYASNGAQCNDGQPCGSGLTCVTPPAATNGTCMPVGTTVGAACDPKRQTNPVCDFTQGLYCEGTTKKCAALAFAGAGQPCGRIGTGFTACTGGSECVAGAPGADGGVSSMCVAPVADGAACNTVSGPPCARPARCVGSALDGGASGKCAIADATQCH